MPATNSSLLGGWTLNAGSVSVVGSLDSIDAIVANGNLEAFTQAWNMHTKLGNGAALGASAVLFSPNSNGATASVLAPAGGGSGTGGAKRWWRQHRRQRWQWR
ncbi:hypothetical protein [Massilia cavernae]|uniref:hypothetical protein n=1 Tax=Massilia cavernae TaxID=2320864 RepID=UPI0011C380C5|nr:hypothetical protein [Massilia cavernae]